MIQNPPRCSFVSAKGPSVVTILPSTERTTVGVEWLRPAGEDQAADCSELIGEGVDILVGPLKFLLREGLVVAVDCKQVLRHLGAPCPGCRHRIGASPSLRAGSAGIDRGANFSAPDFRQSQKTLAARPGSLTAASPRRGRDSAISG